MIDATLYIDAVIKKESVYINMIEALLKDISLKYTEIFTDICNQFEQVGDRSSVITQSIEG
jgi:hypothetical protein